MRPAAVGAALLCACGAPPPPCAPLEGCPAPLACDRGRCTDPARPPSPDEIAARRLRIVAAEDATVVRGPLGGEALGPTDFLVVGGSDGDAAWRTYLRFDLGPLGASADVVRADLVLQTRDDVPGLKRGAVLFGVHRVARTWGAAITWRSQPGPAGDERAVARVPTARRLRIRVDVRALVRDWIRGVFPDRGLVLVARREDEDRRAVFYSSRTPEAAFRPALEVWLRAGTRGIE